MIKRAVRWLLTRLFRVRLLGIEHYHQAGDRVLIVANHCSYLDPILLWAFLPDEVTFAISTLMFQRWWVKPGLWFAKVFPMNTLQPLSVKALTNYVKGNRKAAIFPEGRITVTGSLMKIYEGAALIADKADAMVLPIRIDGTQYTPFSHLQGVVRLRWFPPITMTLLPPRKLTLPAGVTGHERRRRLGLLLSDLMSNMIFETGRHRQTLFGALLDARAVHGGGHALLEDLQRQPLSYNRLIAGALALGKALLPLTRPAENVGLLLPNLNSTVAAFLGLQVHGRVPALLNYSAGLHTLRSCCGLARIKTLLTSRQFITAANLQGIVTALAERIRIVYLEDVAATIGLGGKIRAYLAALSADYWYRRRDRADDPAVILFTSGSEGAPKGVVLSHANLLSNREQLAARLDLTPRDVLLNAMPMFHAFGLTAGTLLPLLYGMRTFLYPSPLHYRIIPEIAYDINATVLFGTNTFLAGYAKHANPYDFYRVRYVFAGAEKLQPETRRLWAEKFGLRVMEGYGTTETAPILTANTPMFYRAGTVGRFMPGIDWRLEEVPGVEMGGRLHVAGPNVMLGYLRPDQSGALDPPSSRYGQGWYDTGDIVQVDDEGFVTILGRAKRFAKVGGEMISLALVEDLAARLWPGHLHAAVTLPDDRRGEKIVLATQYPAADRGALAKYGHQQGYSELVLPREVRVIKDMPLLATGKVDYPALTSRIRDGQDAA